MKTAQITTSTLALLIAFSAQANDLFVDNATIIKDATVMGSLYFPRGSTATGGTITTNDNYRIHTFTNVGTNNFVVTGDALTCDVLIVAGGGGGGSGYAYQAYGGGGAGGVTNLASYVASGSVSVVVGAGGSGGDMWGGVNGSNSAFGSATAFGGGAPRMTNGASGGSGAGGGSQPDYLGGSGVDGQGHAGGSSYLSSGYAAAGGGGGVWTVGANGAVNAGGAGGSGVTNSISGSPVVYGGGGGGGGFNWNAGAGGSGGGGGGGRMAAGSPGTANTGGGGGGGAANGATPCANGAGGSGIVIVRYAITGSTNTAALSISANGIMQSSASSTNVFMGKMDIQYIPRKGDLDMGCYTNQ